MRSNNHQEWLNHTDWVKLSLILSSLFKLGWVILRGDHGNTGSQPHSTPELRTLPPASLRLSNSWENRHTLLCPACASISKGYNGSIVLHTTFKPRSWMRSTEGKKPLWYYPVKISIFCFLQRKTRTNNLWTPSPSTSLLNTLRVPSHWLSMLLFISEHKIEIYCALLWVFPRDG